MTFNPAEHFDNMVSEDNSMAKAMTRMDETHLAMVEFTDLFNAWDGEEVQADIADDFTQVLTPEARNTLLMQLLLSGHAPNHDSLSFADKEFGLRLAEKLGPDWCQWLYKFAVFMTKVA